MKSTSKTESGSAKLQSERDRFIKAARELGAEHEAAFDAKLAKIAKQKPKDETKLKKKDR